MTEPGPVVYRPEQQDLVAVLAEEVSRKCDELDHVRDQLLFFKAQARTLQRRAESAEAERDALRDRSEARHDA